MTSCPLTRGISHDLPACRGDIVKSHDASGSALFAAGGYWMTGHLKTERSSSSKGESTGENANERRRRTAKRRRREKYEISTGRNESSAGPILTKTGPREDNNKDESGGGRKKERTRRELYCASRDRVSLKRTHAWPLCASNPIVDWVIGAKFGHRLCIISCER